MSSPTRPHEEVERCMTTDLFTVRAQDAVDQVANLMSSERIRHVPVVDDDHRLMGLVSYRSLLRLATNGRLLPPSGPMAVSEIMKTDVITVTAQTPTLEAIALMRRYRIGCLPVLQDGKLVGLLTEENFMDIVTDFLEQKLNG